MGSTHPTLFIVCLDLSNGVDVIFLECINLGFKLDFYRDVFSTLVESNSFESVCACRARVC
jgi:hypothetical protein